MRLALKPLGAKPARTLPSWVGEVAPNEARVRVTPVRNGGHENVQTPEAPVWGPRSVLASACVNSNYVTMPPLKTGHLCNRSAGGCKISA